MSGFLVNARCNGNTSECCKQFEYVCNESTSPSLFRNLVLVNLNFVEFLCELFLGIGKGLALNGHRCPPCYGITSIVKLRTSLVSSVTVICNWPLEALNS